MIVNHFTFFTLTIPMLIRSLLPSSSFKPHCMSLSSSLSSSKPTGILKNMSCFKISIFINCSCKRNSTASTIYENANFETTHCLFKIPVDLDNDNEDEKDIQNGLNEDDGNKQQIELLNNTSYNISFE